MSKRRDRKLAVLAAVFVSMLVVEGIPARSQPANTSGKPVSGTVLDGRVNRPVPGLVVQLQNQQVGPSLAVTTSPSGVYYFPSVPSNISTPYVIQVTWGTVVVYKNYLQHLGQQDPIILH
jgi:hypothetical protein